ncbi:MAG TPA: BNR-4 repeat-containing protein, partial [Ilumatobacteraceae bacterium]|nr:BNR-4 repeat-containing protein [Ilumatobacteraceae bacterium]
MCTHARLTACALTAALAVATGDGRFERPTASSEPVVLNDNGAWSWFEDERAVIDGDTGTLLVSSVASGAGSGGMARHGNIEVVAYDMASKDARRTVLHANLEADDHDSAALFVRTDGRYVAAYSRHNTDGLTRWRVSDGSGSQTAWRPEQTFDHGAGTTYSNLYSAPGVDDRLYNFVRSAGRDPHFLVSDDDGSTWTFGGRLLDGPGRPYVRYATDGTGRIHLVTTEQHPLDFGNSVYHGVIDDGQLRRADGTPVDTDLSDRVAVDPTRLTKVFAGDDRHRAWTIDLQIDAAGRPYAAFSVRSPGGHRYHYARFDGAQWR